MFFLKDSTGGGWKSIIYWVALVVILLIGLGTERRLDVGMLTSEEIGGFAV